MLFQRLYGLSIYRAVFISKYQTELELQAQWVCQQGLSAKLWENCDLIHQPLVIDIFVWGEFPVYIIFQTVCQE
jgi:hypothetical protein